MLQLLLNGKWTYIVPSYLIWALKALKLSILCSHTHLRDSKDATSVQKAIKRILKPVVRYSQYKTGDLCLVTLFASLSISDPLWTESFPAIGVLNTIVGVIIIVCEIKYMQNIFNSTFNPS